MKIFVEPRNFLHFSPPEAGGNGGRRVASPSRGLRAVAAELRGPGWGVAELGPNRAGPSRNGVSWAVFESRR